MLRRSSSSNSALGASALPSSIPGPVAAAKKAYRRRSLSAQELETGGAKKTNSPVGGHPPGTPEPRKRRTSLTNAARRALGLTPGKSGRQVQGADNEVSVGGKTKNVDDLTSTEAYYLDAQQWLKDWGKSRSALSPCDSISPTRSPVRPSRFS